MQNFLLGMAASFALIGIVSGAWLAIHYGRQWYNLTEAIISMTAWSRFRARMPAQDADTMPEWQYQQARAQLNAYAPGRH